MIKYAQSLKIFTKIQHNRLYTLNQYVVCFDTIQLTVMQLNLMIIERQLNNKQTNKIKHN